MWLAAADTLGGNVKNAKSFKRFGHKNSVQKQFAPFIGLLNKLIHKILAGMNASISLYIQKAFMCQTGSLWALTFDKIKLDLKKGWEIYTLMVLRILINETLF